MLEDALLRAQALLQLIINYELNRNYSPYGMGVFDPVMMWGNQASLLLFFAPADIRSRFDHILQMPSGLARIKEATALLDEINSYLDAIRVAREAASPPTQKTKNRKADRDDDPTSKNREIVNTLTDKQRSIIVALGELKAINRDKQCKLSDVVIQIAGPGADPNQYKHDAANLAKFAEPLVESSRGRGSGRWLTPLGITVYNYLSGKQLKG